MQELGHETALLSHINHGFGSIAWQCMLPGRDILKDVWFCFCFFLSLPEVSLPAQHWHVAHQALEVLDGDSPRGISQCLSQCWTWAVGLPSCRGSLSPASVSTRVVPFLMISQNPSASWTALLLVDGELGMCLWGVSLQEGPCWFLLLFPCIPLSSAVHPHTDGLSRSQLHFHASVEDSVSCPLQRVSSSPLACLWRSKMRSRIYPCFPSPCFWGLHGLRGAAVGSCEWLRSLPASCLCFCPAIKHCWCPSPHGWNEAWRLIRGFL